MAKAKAKTKSRTRIKRSPRKSTPKSSPKATADPEPIPASTPDVESSRDKARKLAKARRKKYGSRGSNVNVITTELKSMTDTQVYTLGQVAQYLTSSKKSIYALRKFLKNPTPKPRQRSAWSEFVSTHYKDEDIQNMDFRDRMSALSKKYKSSQNQEVPDHEA